MSNDICQNGGKDAIEKFSSTHPNNKLGGNMKKEDLQAYINLLRRILTECPSHDNVTEEVYFLSRIMMVYYFSKDSTTGNSCMDQIGATHNISEDTYDAGLFRIPYSEWSSDHCESSCVSELDPIYRDYAKTPACDTSNSKNFEKEAFEFRRACEVFKTTGNFKCGKKTFPEKNGPTSTSTSTLVSSVTPTAENNNKDNGICSENGYPTVLNYLKEHPNFSSIDTVKKDELEEFISIVKPVLEQCPNHDDEIEEIYYMSRILLVFHFSQDNITGNKCLVQLGATYNTQNNSYDLGFYRQPYHQWKPEQCESSCVAELDPVFRELSTSVACDKFKENSDIVQFGNACEFFKASGNPTCGDINYAKIYENKSDATTYTTSPILLLFSLILCLLLTLFK